MKLINIILIAILMVLLVVDMAGLQIISAFNRTFLEPSFYKKIGTKQEFYAQTRQLIFRLISKSLPNGREGMPYFEKALTENWLKGEMDELIVQFFNFVKGRRKEPPIIPIYKLKDQIAQSIDGNKTWIEKQRMVQYWFAPLPDEVRLQDFISIQLISSIKEKAMDIRRLLWALIGIFVLLSGLMYVTVLDWKTAALWIVTAMMTSGIQIVLTGLGIEWLLRHSSYIIGIYNSIVAFEIPEESAWGLIQAFKKGFTDPLISAGIALAIIGGIAIYVLPIRERSLTLIK